MLENVELEVREAFNAERVQIRDKLLEMAQELTPQEPGDIRRFFYCENCKCDLKGRFVIFQVCRDMKQHRDDIVPEVFKVYCPTCWNKGLPTKKV